MYSGKLLSLVHQADSLELRAGSQTFNADLVVDCTGRFNALSHQLLKREYEFVEGDLRFAGGGWDESLDAFSVLSPDCAAAENRLQVKR